MTDINKQDYQQENIGYYFYTFILNDTEPHPLWNQTKQFTARKPEEPVYFFPGKVQQWVACQPVKRKQEEIVLQRISFLTWYWGSIVNKGRQKKQNWQFPLVALRFTLYLCTPNQWIYDKDYTTDCILRSVKVHSWLWGKTCLTKSFSKRPLKNSTSTFLFFSEAHELNKRYPLMKTVRFGSKDVVAAFKYSTVPSPRSRVAVILSILFGTSHLLYVDNKIFYVWKVNLAYQKTLYNVSSVYWNCIWKTNEDWRFF